MKFEKNQSISSVFSHILTVTDDIRWWAIAIRFLSLYESMIIIDYHRLSSMIIYYQLPKWFAHSDDYQWSWWRCKQDRSRTARSKAQSIDCFSKIDRFRQSSSIICYRNISSVIIDDHRFVIKSKLASVELTPRAGLDFGLIQKFKYWFLAKLSWAKTTELGSHSYFLAVRFGP